MENEEKKKFTIGIIGGTGKEGKGLAYRWVKAGHKVLIGSRQREKALKAVETVSGTLGGQTDLLQGMENHDAVAASEIAVITVPYAAHRPTLKSLKNVLEGKILIDVVVPIVPPRVTKVQMPEAGSVAKEAQAILGDNCRVVDAFQNISHERLIQHGEIDCDVLVAGKGKDARKVVLGLVEDAGLRGWDAGPIDNTVVVEGLTPILIGLNIQHHVHDSGIRITGINIQE